MEKINFSTDKKHSEEDSLKTLELAEAYFKTEDDPAQISATEENRKWIDKNIPDCRNIIKAGNKVVGFTFMIPCNKKIMEDFLLKKINENQLFEEVKKKVNYRNFDTIYLCSSFIVPEFRGKGLAIQGRVKSIKKIIEKRNIKPVLFYDAWTNEGERSCRKTAKVLGLELKKR